MIKQTRLATIIVAMALVSATRPAWGVSSNPAAAPAPVDYSAFVPAAPESSDPQTDGSAGFPGFAALREADQPAEPAINVKASRIE